jgi:hypothetical protein
VGFEHEKAKGKRPDPGKVKNPAKPKAPMKKK